MKHIDKEIIENTLWPEDETLFEKIGNNYISENERIFFETIYKKMQTELAPCSELLLSEAANPEQIYFLRTQYDEFIVGQGKWDNRKEEIHTMNLSEALNINMKKSNFLPIEISFLGMVKSD